MGTPTYGGARLMRRRGQEKSDQVIREYLRSLDTVPRVGPSMYASGGACCLVCRRYIMASLIQLQGQGRREFVAAACCFCARVLDAPPRIEGIDG